MKKNLMLIVFMISLLVVTLITGCSQEKAAAPAAVKPEAEKNLYYCLRCKICAFFF